MKIHTGVDLCSVVRIDGAYRSFGMRFVERICQSVEIANLKTLPDVKKIYKLSGCFAVKEAFSKVVGLGLMGSTFRWNDVGMLNYPSGKPFLVLSEKMVQQYDHWDFDVSLSYENQIVCAVVVAIENETKKNN